MSSSTVTPTNNRPQHLMHSHSLPHSSAKTNPVVLYPPNIYSSLHHHHYRVYLGNDPALIQKPPKFLSCLIKRNFRKPMTQGYNTGASSLLRHNRRRRIHRSFTPKSPSLSISNFCLLLFVSVKFEVTFSSLSFIVAYLDIAFTLVS